jgi:outer membrane protein assembly factor BamB
MKLKNEFSNIRFKKCLKNTLIITLLFFFIIASFSQIIIAQQKIMNEHMVEDYTINYISIKKINYESNNFSENSIFKNHTYIRPISSDSSPWSMYCHDTRHTGRSPYNTADNPGTIKWKYETGDDWIDSSPAIDENGTIYVGSDERCLFAFNPNGTIKWRFDTNGWLESSPAIGKDGTIYVGSRGGHLYAINSNGTLKWRFNANDIIRSSPAIAEDGTIYFGVVGPGWDIGRIHAVNPNGTEKWHFDTNDWVYSSPAIGEDGIVYCTSNDNHLYALYPENGTMKWSFKRGAYLGSPSIGDDGTIYTACWDDYLYAVYPENGTMKWRSKLGFGCGHTPTVAGDGTIFVGEDLLYAIYPNGTRKWSFNPGGNLDVTSVSQAVSADGIIYIGTSLDTAKGGYLIAVNPDGTERWRVWIHNDHVYSSPAIGSDGTVYIGSAPHNNGILYAIGPLDPDAPSAPIINGPSEGKKGNEYSFTFKSTDPNGDDVYYYISWNDGKDEEWIGPYSSGYELTVNHTWKNENTFTIKARARDTDYLWGPESEFEIIIPRNKVSYNSLFLRFLERFPMLQKLLHILY